MPLEEEGVSLNEIYGQVLIEQDFEAMRKTRKPEEFSSSKSLNSMKDMFYVKDNLARRIILTGEAGHGKTVLSLKILDSWSKSNCVGHSCISKQCNCSRKVQMSPGYIKRNVSRGKFKICDDEDEEKEEEVELQQCLSNFDLVFYVPLRHAKHRVSCIIDLVCDSVSECDQNTKRKIKEILCNSNILCLVILDGLDEWKAPDTCRVSGFPDIDDLVNCTVLYTMRPWRMVNLHIGLDLTCDKAVQLLGLKRDSVEKVISNVLIHFYGLNTTSPLYEQKFKYFRRRAYQIKLWSLMKIPLMLTASCLVWNEEGEVFDSAKCVASERKSDQRTPYFMSFFYLKLIVLTITRAENKYDVVKIFLSEMRQNPNGSLNVPSILLEFETIIDFFPILKPVGRLALLDLLSTEPNLVFPKNKLEREIGQSNVDLALKVGLLSQAKAPGLSYQQRVSVSFYHKSIQEFIAALYMTCWKTDAISSFCAHCNTVEKVQELSNMIKFTFGLDPVVGCQLSKHVKGVVDKNDDISQYREVRVVDISFQTDWKVYSLLMRQFDWFREMKCNLSHTQQNDNKPTFHVSDVYLDKQSCISTDELKMTTELVNMENNSIVSVFLDRVEHPVHSIIQHLPRCKNLTSLFIWNVTETHDLQLLSIILPQLLHLQYLSYRYLCSNPDFDVTTVLLATEKICRLKYIYLQMNKFPALTETVTLPPQLETVMLSCVAPAHLILPSLRQCSQLKYLKLYNIYLTDHVTMAHWSLLENLVISSVRPVNFILPSVCQSKMLKNIELNSAYLAETVHLPPMLETVKLHCVRPAECILPSLLTCTRLTSLAITYPYYSEDCEMLVNVLPRLVNLRCITYHGTEFRSRVVPDDAAVVRALLHLSQLEHIDLRYILLPDSEPCSLLINPQMTQLEKVELRNVEMSSMRWKAFVSSLRSVQHAVHIKLQDTHVDAQTVKTINESQGFTVFHYRDWSKSDHRRVDMTFSTEP